MAQGQSAPSEPVAFSGYVVEQGSGSGINGAVVYVRNNTTAVISPAILTANVPPRGDGVWSQPLWTFMNYKNGDILYVNATADGRTTGVNVTVVNSTPDIQVPNFTFDTRPPVGSGQGPSGSICLPSATATVDVTDAGAGVNQSSIRVTVQGTNVTSSCASASIAGGYRYTCPLTFPGTGSATASLEASDALGHTMSPYNWSFTLADCGPPTATIDFPPASNTTSTGIPVQANVSDDYSTIAFVEASLSNDTAAGGRNFSRTRLTLLAGSLYTGTLDIAPVADGNYTLYVNATDTAGNSRNTTNTSGHNIRIDRPPLVSIVFPGDFNTTSGSIAVQATVTDDLTGVAFVEASLSNDTTSGGRNFSRTRLTSAGGNAWSGNLGIEGLADGNYTLYVNATDTAGNSRNTTGTTGLGIRIERPTTPTTTTTTTTGGGPPGNQPPAEVATVAEQTQTQEAREVKPGVPVVLSFPRGEVTRVTIETGAGAALVQVTVSSLRGLPSSVPTPVPGLVLRYLSIEAKGIEAGSIRSAEVEVQVPRSWLEDQGLDPGRVQVQRYTTRWEVLETRRVGEDATHIRYGARTPGFSIFAITAEPSAPPREAQSPTPMPTEEPRSPQATAAPAPRPAPTPAAPPVGSAAGVLLGVVAAAALLYIRRRRRRGRGLTGLRVV